jgi:hypothetical protein
MMSDISINEIISKSFSYIFQDFKKIFKESFFTVFLLTLIFNGLYFLSLENIATKFTFFIFFTVMGLIVSTIAYKVHRNILLKQNVKNPLLKIFDLINIKYLFYSSLISTFALCPVLLKIYFDKNNIPTILGIDTKYLLLVLLITVFLSFKLIINLPRISLGNSIGIFGNKSSNRVTGKLFLIFIIITLAFLLPTYVVLSIQIYFLENSQEFFKFLKPFFDFISFFISYLNYAAVFAALSYSYKEIKD